MAVKGLTIPIKADAKEFNKEIRKVDRSIRGTVKEVDALAKSLEVEWDADRFIQAQKSAQKAIEQTDQKVLALRQRLEFLDETKTDKQSAEYQKLRTQLVNTEAKAVLLKQKMEEISNLKLNRVAEGFKKVGDGISQAGQKLVPFSAAAAGLLGSFAAIGLSAVKAGDEIGTTAQQLGISTDALQRWQYVAQQTDVSMEKLRAGAIKVQEGMAKLATGDTSEATKALEQLGFSTEDAAKGMDENFDTIILKLASVEDATQQAALANKIFGGELGANIIPLLNDGAAGLQQLSEEFDSFNTLTNQQIQDLDAFEDTMDKLSFQFEQQKNQIGAALLPLMQNLAAIVQEKIIPAVQVLVDWFASLSINQQKVLFGVTAFIATLAPMLLIMGKLTSGVGGVIKAVQGLRVALTFLSAHPIILVIVGLIALFALLYKQNEEFRESIQNLVKTLSSLLMPILSIVGDLFNEIMAAVMPLIEVFLQVLAPVLTIVVNLISHLVGILSKVLVPYLKFVGKVWAEIFGFIPKIIQGVVDSVEWMINQIIDGINWLIKKINDIGQYIGFTIDEIQRVEFGEVFPESDPVSIESDIQEPDAGIPTVPAEEATAAIETSPDLSGMGTGPIVDNSTKDIEINVTVENFAREVDVDDLIQQINVKLAEAL